LCCPGWTVTGVCAGRGQPPGARHEDMAKTIGNDDVGAGSYGIDQIKVLEGSRRFRKRPAMYIGGRGPRGCTTWCSGALAWTSPGRGVRPDQAVPLPTASPSPTTGAASSWTSTSRQAGRARGGRDTTPEGSSAGRPTRFPAACTGRGIGGERPVQWLKPRCGWAAGSICSYERGKPAGDVEIGKARCTAPG
jgi:hypothetical protein